MTYEFGALPGPFKITPEDIGLSQKRCFIGEAVQTSSPGPDDFEDEEEMFDFIVGIEKELVVDDEIYARKQEHQQLHKEFAELGFDDLKDERRVFIGAVGAFVLPQETERVIDFERQKISDIVAFFGSKDEHLAALNYGKRDFAESVDIDLGTQTKSKANKLSKEDKAFEL